jgi:hypothetical protein
MLTFVVIWVAFWLLTWLGCHLTYPWIEFDWVYELAVGWVLFWTWPVLIWAILARCVDMIFEEHKKGRGD